MKIIKKENGNVLLTDGSGNTVKRFPEGAVIELENNGRGEFVRIAYGHQNKHDIYPSTITATQLEPAAEVAFSGTAQDLLNLLSASFFFEVVSSSDADFQEQDDTTSTSVATYTNRHIFSGDLSAGIYEIGFYTYMQLITNSGSIDIAITIDSVAELEVRNGFSLNERKPIFVRYILNHAGGSVDIEGQFKRNTAGTTASCEFSNMIIKKIG